MTKEEIKKFAKAIQQNFKPPFVPEGLVEINVHEDGEGFELIIGPRDVDFDKDLNVLGAGTCLV